MYYTPVCAVRGNYTFLLGGFLICLYTEKKSDFSDFFAIIIIIIIMSVLFVANI